MHRLFVFVAATMVCGIAGTIMSSPAEAYDRRICMISSGFFYPGDCSYDTFKQCRAAASGQQAYCDVNPSYLFDKRAGIKRRHTDGWNLSPFLFGGQIYQP